MIDKIVYGVIVSFYFLLWTVADKDVEKKGYSQEGLQIF